MTAERWQTVKASFLEAASLDPEEQEAFLRDLASADREISEMVRHLLATTSSQGVDLRRPCWSLAPPRDDQRTFETGRRLLDRFEIVGFLGAGGWGEVYRAFDHQQRVPVALKTIHPSLAQNASAASMLRKELNAARSVTHPNVCRLFDFHWDAGAAAPPFFTMELLEGETLSDRLRRAGPFSTADAWPLIEQILSALEAAHSAGIVHRDLKASNVMLTNGESRAVVMDFGLARDVTPGRDLQTTFASNGVAGTPAYMAPEQLRGEPATFASDIHAFGVLLFEMMTGRRPFEGASPLEVASRRLNEEAPPARRYASGLDRKWEFTIARCLEKQPQARPQSPEEVRRLLQSPPPVLWMRRRVVWAAGVATIGAAAAIAGPDRIRAIAGLGRRSDSADAAMDFYVRGNTLLQEGTPESVRDAMQQFERALDAAPQFALAAAAMAEACLVRRNFGFEPEAQLTALAGTYGERAVRLDPNVAEGHAALGAVRQSEWDWVAAEKHYDTALRLKPRFARARRWRSGLVLQFARFDEALADVKLAFEQDPYDRNAVPGYLMTLMFAEKLREAVDFAVQHIGDRDMPSARNNLALVYAKLGQHSKGGESAGYFRLAFAEAGMIAAIEGKMRASNSEMSTRLFAIIHSVHGDSKAARPHLRRLEEGVASGRTSPGHVAVVYACQGRSAEALDTLDRAMSIRDGFLMYLRVHPFLERLWGLPRFEAMLRELKLK